MTIGSTIKKLRREHDMTQEQLAEYLGLTPSAISQWETDRVLPDVTQLPLLANIFRVSTDRLLGVDIELQEKRIDDIVLNAFDVKANGDAAEAEKMIREGLEEFPSSYSLMSSLADFISTDMSKSKDERTSECIKIYEKIIEGDSDPYRINNAQGHLCGIYMSQGRYEEAKKIADSIPVFMYSHDDTEIMVSQGMDKVYALHYAIGNHFFTACDYILDFAKIRVDDKPILPFDKTVSLYKKVIELYSMFYEDGDYLGNAVDVSRAYAGLAELYAEKKDREGTLVNIEMAAQYARMADEYCDGFAGHWLVREMPAEKKHTSVLADPEFDYPTTTCCIDGSDGTTIEYIRGRLGHERFDFVRGDTRFSKAVEK